MTNIIYGSDVERKMRVPAWMRIAGSGRAEPGVRSRLLITLASLQQFPHGTKNHLFHRACL
jgi:hypothetical protein